MTGKMRRDRSNMIEQKATHASHFKGIFEEAQNETDPIDEKQVDLLNFLSLFFGIL